MGYYLTIDRGNTTSKTVVWEGSKPVAEMTQANARNAITDDAETRRIADFLAPYAGNPAIICSVSGSVDHLQEVLASLDIELLALQSSTPLPIAIDYLTPSTLGTDRIAAAVGAATLWPGREVLIVDIGTATTFDRVSAKGHFIGGNIAPGVGMRLRALCAFTSALPEVKSLGDTPQWGQSTETAMRSGAIYGVVGEISYYRSLLPDDAVVVLTGGWSADIARYLKFPVELNQLLVNQGLNRILQYNETN